nr:hypothetical protein [Tanacetum cinerariifolium]
LLLPSTPHRYDIPEADMPLRKRSGFFTLAFRFNVRESSAAAARQAGHALTREVNERVTDLAITQRQDSQELYVHCEDAHDDRALLRARVSLLMRERRYFHLMASSYECEGSDARRAWAHS